MEWTLKISTSMRSMLALRMRDRRHHALGLLGFPRRRAHRRADPPDHRSRPGHEPGERTVLAGTIPGILRQATGKKAIVPFTESREPTRTASPPLLAYAANASSTGSTSRSRPDRKTVTKAKTAGPCSARGFSQERTGGSVPAMMLARAAGTRWCSVGSC